MKIQKVAALMLSMALTFSTCMPLNGITALGAETGSTAVEASAQEEVSDFAESTEIQQEEDHSSETENVETTALEEDEAVDDRMESSDEAEAVEPQNEEETAVESESSSDEDIESAAPAQETDSSKGEERSMSGTKSNSSVEQSPDAVETESEEIETLSDDVNQDFHAWPDGEDEYCSDKYITVLPGESVEMKVNTSAEDTSSLSYT